jgi:outer membrane lipoprotein-sorting protein
MLGAGLFAQTIEQAYKIVDETYEQYNYGDLDYSCTVTLITEKPDTPTEQMQFKMFQRSAKEQFTLVQILPEADKGTGYLADGDNFWFYDPISRKFSHSSLKDNVGSSDAKASDMTDEYQWRDDYQVTAIAEGKLGQYPVWIITLEAISDDPSYAKDIYYIRKDYPIVLKQENYSASDRLMRTLLMPKYTKVNGKYIATQTIIRDELNKGEQTQQIVSEIYFGPLEDKVFTKAYLESLN